MPRLRCGNCKKITTAAALAGGASADTLKAAARLRTQGRITDATIVILRERYVSIRPGSANG